MTAPPDYLFTVITRGNSVACDFDPRFWAAHPEWNYFVRTNRRKSPLVWVGGGGVTLGDAVECAEDGLRHYLPETFGDTAILRGEESPAVIRNGGTD